MGSSINTRAIEISAQEYASETEQQPFVHETSNFSQQQLQMIKKPTNTNAGQQNDNSNQEQQNLEEMQQKQYVLFKDQQFPHNQESISKDPNFRRNMNIVWKRPIEFLQPDQINLFDTIYPDDVKQGALGNCYLLSPLSVMAKFPQIIQNLFQQQKYQYSGLYKINIFKNGIPVEIVIDDYIPCNEQGNPIYSKAKGNKLWVILLEKAYAKLYGSYSQIEGGTPQLAVKDLTGAPSEYIMIMDVNSCWDFMEKNNKQKYLLTATTKLKDNFENDIVSNKVYSILDLQSVIGSDEQPDKIVKLRNPWGQKEWKKDWSDNSAKWTPDLIQKLQIKQEDDGIFWMSIKDFITQFEAVFASKVSQDYFYTPYFLKVEDQDLITIKLVKMNVATKTHAFIQLSQSDKRFLQKDHPYSLIRLIVGQLDKKNIEVLNYLGEAFDVDRDCFIEKEFEPGSYVIYVEVDWDQNYDRYLAVSCYGSSQVQFSELALEKSQITNIFDGLLRAHGRSSNQVKITQQGPGIQTVAGKVAGYIYYWYKNQTKIKTLKQQIKFTQMQNLEICPPFQNLEKNNKTQIHVQIECQPNSNFIVKYRITKSGRGSYSYQMRVSSQIQTQQSKSEEDIVYLALLKPNQKKQRQLQGNNIQVFFYEVEFSDGIAFLYENKESRTYKEKIQFKLNNIKGVGIDVSQVIEIVIPPRQQKLIQLQKNGQAIDFSYQIATQGIELK